MIVVKKIIDIDPVIKLLLFCLLFYFLSNLKIYSDNQLLDKINGQPDFIEIEREGSFPVVHQININNLSSTPLPSSILNSEIINGKKYYLDKNDYVFKTSTINGKHKIALGIAIDINSARFDDLTALPGIGPKIAERILKYKKFHGKFKDKQELMEVKGIGLKTYKKIEKYITY
ncbi:MAG: helix-hairpin-helix domain-containing protein [Deltaproteobacteria bacterium]|nr:MAG: helix-hairpin-helix domain-containing protein [Deltaproteobacteria bacterium]